MANDSIFEGLDQEATALLHAARATTPASPDAGLLTAMAAAAVDGPVPISSRPRRTTMIGKLITAKALGLAGALVLTGGVAAAATGTLPDPVQTPVSNAAEHVGVHIPEGEHGAAVSAVAHDKSNDGDGNHGATVSETARQNHGHEGDATTTTTVAGDDNGGTTNSGPGNNGKGNAKGHTKAHDATDDNEDQVTTTTVANTPTTVDDDANDSARSGSSSSGSSNSGSSSGGSSSGSGNSSHSGQSGDSGHGGSGTDD
ncbi:MAG: hypothetical protein QOJ00_1575 [Actinomycetota bacterium]